MSGNSLKIALILSLAFNGAVIGAVVYGSARRSATREGTPPMSGVEVLGGRCTHLCKGLGVSRERVVLFSEAMATSSRDLRATRLRLQKARGELIDLIRTSEPDEKAVMAKVDEISSLQGELEKGLVQRLLRASTVLLPEERERLMHVIRSRCMPCGTMDLQGPGDKGSGPEGVPQQQEVGE